MSRRKQVSDSAFDVSLTDKKKSKSTPVKAESAAKNTVGYVIIGGVASVVLVVILIAVYKVFSKGPKEQTPEETQPKPEVKTDTPQQLAIDPRVLTSFQEQINGLEQHTQYLNEKVVEMTTFLNKMYGNKKKSKKKSKAKEQDEQEEQEEQNEEEQNEEEDQPLAEKVSKTMDKKINKQRKLNIEKIKKVENRNEDEEEDIYGSDKDEDDEDLKKKREVKNVRSKPIKKKGKRLSKPEDENSEIDSNDEVIDIGSDDEEKEESKGKEVEIDVDEEEDASDEDAPEEDAPEEDAPEEDEGKKKKKT